MEKLTLSLDGAVIRRAKQYAAARQTSVSRLVESLLDRLTAHDADAPPPVLTKLRGSLKGVSLNDYRRHLERKHL